MARELSSGLLRRRAESFRASAVMSFRVARLRGSKPLGVARSY
jgi:hypothetical protein